MAGAKGGHLAKHRAPDRVCISGHFVCNDASAPTTVEGDGFTVSAPSTGAYTITLTDGLHAGADSLNVSLAQATSAAATVIAINTWRTTIASAGTFILETHSAAGTEANLDNTNVVSFTLWVRNTAVTRRSGA